MAADQLSDAADDTIQDLDHPALPPRLIHQLRRLDRIGRCFNLQVGNAADQALRERLRRANGHYCGDEPGLDRHCARWLHLLGFFK